MLNIILYILGAIAVIAAGIYFFMRREPEQSAADIARSQSQEIQLLSLKKNSQLKRKRIQNQNLNQKQSNQFKKKHKQKLQKQKKILLQKIQTISRLIMTMKITIDNRFSLVDTKDLKA